MMKKMDVSQFVRVLALALLITFGSSSVSYAQVCAPPGNAERSQTVINQIQQRTQDVLDKVQGVAFKLQELATMISGNAAGNTAAAIAANKMNHEKDVAQAQTQAESQITQLAESEQTAQDTKVVAGDCVMATGTASQPEGEILTSAAEGAMNNDDNNALSNVSIDDGNDLEPTSSERRNKAGRVNTARGSNYAVPKSFRDYIIYFCDPKENGGNMPDADNPLTYVNRSGEQVNYWCGMGRDDNSQYLAGAPQNMSLILADGFFSTWESYSGLYGAFEQMKRDLTGVEVDVVNSSSFNSPEGQTRYMQMRAKATKQALARSVINDAGARRQPTYTVGDGDFNWLKAICVTSLGSDSSPQYLEMCNNLKDRVSEAAWMEGMVKQFTNPDYIMTTLAQIESPVRMLAEANKILAQNMKITHLRMLQAEKRNLLMAAILAEGLQ